MITYKQHEVTKMKVLITAGHTVEKIDNVRHIANLSTGQLGAAIAECFAERDYTKEICYICNNTAVKPKAAVRLKEVSNVADLEAAVFNEIRGGGFDIVIHAMAVSDYRVKGVGCLYKIADGFDAPRGKIDSNIEDLLLLLEPTPKIISSYRKLGFDGILVGFKLLDGASFEQLIDRAFDLLVTNGCDYVLANDQKSLSLDPLNHTGYLVAPDRSYQKFESKTAIARGIADTVTRRFLTAGQEV